MFLPEQEATLRIRSGQFGGTTVQGIASKPGDMSSSNVLELDGGRKLLGSQRNKRPCQLAKGMQQAES